jgi:hypothetical protein
VRHPPVSSADAGQHDSSGILPLIETVQVRRMKRNPCATSTRIPPIGFAVIPELSHSGDERYEN